MLSLGTSAVTAAFACLLPQTRTHVNVKMQTKCTGAENQNGPFKKRAAYAYIYFQHISYDTFSSNTNISLTLKRLCIRSRHSEVNTMCMYFFIDLSYQRVAHETIKTACLWDSMMYLCFIYLCFLICSTHFQKKICGFGFGEFEGIALNVANCWKRSKMPRCSGWLQPERNRKMQFYIL